LNGEVNASTAARKRHGNRKGSVMPRQESKQ